MRKKLYAGIIIAALCFGVAGCGKVETDNKNSENQVTSAESSSPDVSIAPENNDTNTSEPEETSDTSEPNDISETPDTSNSNNKPEETEKPKTEVVKFTSEQQYSDIYRVVSFLGLKEYEKLEDDNGTYTDKPQKGNKFLVLFLSIKNTSNVDDYINYNYISAKVDGKEIEHTFLVNQPKGYPTIFTNVSANGSIGGFVVWEVPKNWKKFEFTYDGWKDINNISVKAKFTPKDLSNPIIYNANNYS